MGRDGEGDKGAAREAQAPRPEERGGASLSNVALFWLRSSFFPAAFVFANALPTLARVASADSTSSFSLPAPWRVTKTTQLQRRVARAFGAWAALAQQPPQPASNPAPQSPLRKQASSASRGGWGARARPAPTPLGALDPNDPLLGTHTRSTGDTAANANARARCASHTLYTRKHTR